MKVVWEFSLDEKVMMPAGAEVLAFGFQHIPVVWALVDPQQPVVERGFHLLETGEETHEELGRYVGTATDVHGFVLHVFEWASA